MKNTKKKLPTKTSKNNYLKADTRVNSLISHGLTTENIINKNDIINEIFSIWNKENKFLLKKLKLNIGKEEDLENEKKELNNLIKNFDELKKCTSFYNEFTQIPENKKEKLQNLINTIKNLEKEIIPQDEITKPYLLQKIINDKVSDDAKRIQLLDLYYRRSEELSYTLQRKIISIERSQYMSQHLDEHKFSNVTDLINTYRISKAENDALRIEESSIFSDAILKRRHFSQFSTEVASGSVSIFQSDFKTNLNILKWSKNQKSRYLSSKEISFDDVVNDILFLLKPTDYSNEFSSALCQNAVQELTSSKSSASAKLESYKIVLKDLQDSLDQLEGDLKKIRNVKFSKNNQTKGHMEKLWDINDKLFAQLQKYQDYISNSSIFHQDFFAKISAIISDREEEAKKWYIAYYKYLDLIQDHAYISNLQNQNAQLTLSLFSICLYFASKCIEKSEKDSADDHLRTQFDALFPKPPPPPDRSSDAENPPKPSYPTNFTDLLAMKMQKKASSPSRPKTRQKIRKSEKNSSITSQVMQEEEVSLSMLHEMNDISLSDFNPPQVPFVLTRQESILLAAKCMKFAGFLQNMNRSPYDLIKKLIIYILTNSRVRFAQFFQDFSDEFFSNTRLIYELALPYLVVEKKSIAIQTDPPTFRNAENQTMDQKAVKEMIHPPKKRKESKL